MSGPGGGVAVALADLAPWRSPPRSAARPFGAGAFGKLAGIEPRRRRRRRSRSRRAWDGGPGRVAAAWRARSWSTSVCDLTLHLAESSAFFCEFAACELAARRESAASCSDGGGGLLLLELRLLGREELAGLQQLVEQRVVLVGGGGRVLRAGRELGDVAHVDRVERVARAGALVDLGGAGVELVVDLVGLGLGLGGAALGRRRCRPAPGRGGCAAPFSFSESVTIREPLAWICASSARGLRLLVAERGALRDRGRQEAGRDDSEEDNSRDFGPEVQSGDSLWLGGAAVGPY